MTTYTKVLANPIDAKQFTVNAESLTKVTVTATTGALINQAVLTPGSSWGSFDMGGSTSSIALPLDDSCYPLTVTMETDGEDPSGFTQHITWIE
jgi:hypothetical protein